MRRNRRLAITIAIGLAFLLVKQSCISNNRSREEKNDLDHSHIYLAEVVSGIYSNEAIPIDNLKVYRGTNQADTIRLNHLSGNGILIIRLSGEACSVCIEFVVEMVKKVFPDFQHNERIVFIVSQVPDKLKEKYYGKPVYSFTSVELNLPFEVYRVPYFFFLDEHMECKLFFIPELSHPLLTEFYLSTIKTRYFTN